MMEFYSVMAAPRYVIKPADIQFIPTGGGNFQKRVQKGITVEFEPLDHVSQGIPWHGVHLATRNGRVRGRFRTNDPDLALALRQHPAYGTEFIAVSETGKELVDEDYFFMDLPDGQVLFLPTGRKFKSRAGSEGWKQSKEFNEIMESIRKDEFEKFQSQHT